MCVATRASAAQGVAVLGTSGARDDGASLARAVYASTLRPKQLDELHARLLIGDAPPPAATKELKDFAALRAAVNGEDAAARQILAGIAKQIDVQGILVVTRITSEATAAVDPDGGAPVAPGTRVQARLFVAEQGDFDAARYDFDGSWQATVTSVAARFPAPPPPVAAANPVVVAAPPLLRVPPKKEEDRPFYKSPWLWGALGAAVLIGGIFFFASQDKSDDPIHLRMTVPR